MNRNLVKLYCSVELKNILSQQNMVRNHLLFQLIGQRVVSGKETEAMVEVFTRTYRINLKYFGVGEHTISRFTKLTIESRSEIIEGVSFEDLGGLDEEIMKLKEYIDSVLFDEEISEYQIHGVLVHGNHGTGKTDLLNACVRYVQEKGVSNIFEVSVLNFRRFSRNEEELGKIFMSAIENEPSIIICDEIDKCLLTTKSIRTCGVLLEKLTSHRVIFISTTNSVSNVSSLLRRHNRLEREIFLPIPNEKRRLNILKTLLSSHRCKLTIPNEILDSLSERSHGFVGSDLKLLSDRFISKTNELSSLEIETNKKTEILLSVADDLLRKTKPSVIRDIEVSVPKVYWSDIGGQNDLIQNLKECIEWRFEHREAFKRFNLRPPKGVLLYGPPGCSKTLSAKALATECHLNFISVKGPELFSKWVGESEKAVHRLFEKARDASPCILFFDEIDGLAVERGNQNQSAVGDRVLSQLLSELDGIRELEDVILVAATNRPDLIDPALLRPGRVDRMVYVSPPDFQSRIEILNIYIKKMKGHQITKEDVAECAKRTDGYSGAELCALVREAGYIALFETSSDDEKEESEGEEEEKGNDDDGIVIVTNEHLVKASMKIKPRITDEMIRFYENFAKKYKKT